MLFKSTSGAPQERRSGGYARIAPRLREPARSALVAEKQTGRIAGSGLAGVPESLGCHETTRLVVVVVAPATVAALDHHDRRRAHVDGALVDDRSRDDHR